MAKLPQNVLLYIELSYDNQGDLHYLFSPPEYLNFSIITDTTYTKRNTMSKGCIYKIRNMVNGKCYIGQTTYLPNRRGKHRQLLRQGGHWNKELQEEWNIYGEEMYVFENICPDVPINLLDKAEKYYIKVTLATETEFGYNKRPGGFTR